MLFACPTSKSSFDKTADSKTDTIETVAEEELKEAKEEKKEEPKIEKNEEPQSPYSDIYSGTVQMEDSVYE